MLSWGMFASLADSMAALSRMLALGSPPPFFAATVISRRIFENSFPRWTSALPFLRLICDHREWPDIVLPSFLVHRPLASLHATESRAAPHQGSRPATPPAGRLRRDTGAG